jgi:hypothetical protein
MSASPPSASRHFVDGFHLQMRILMYDGRSARGPANPKVRRIRPLANTPPPTIRRLSRALSRHPTGVSGGAWWRMPTPVLTRDGDRHDCT